MPGTLILVRPHTSLLDGPILAWRLRKTPCVFPVDSDYAQHPFWSRLLTLYGWLLGHRMMPLDGQHPASLRHILRALQDGKTVVLFPQGTGLSNPQRPDQPGWMWLWRKSGCAVQELRMD